MKSVWRSIVLVLLLGSGAFSDLHSQTNDEHPVGGALQPQGPDVHCFVAELFQEIDGAWRDTSVGQKPHWFQARIGWISSWARAAVAKRLTDVFLIEVRELRDDLRRRHPVCDEVDDMRDRDPQSADRRPPGEDGRVLRDAIERAFHSFLTLHCSAAIDRAPLLGL